MIRAARGVAAAVVVMFLALLLADNVVQVKDASALRANAHNSRTIYANYDHQRGPILVGGDAVAQSVATKDALKYLRTYPAGPVFAPATGFYSLIYGATGIEQAEDSILAGTDDRLFTSRLSDYFTGRTPQGGAVVLTLNAAAQQAAYAGLGGQRGAVVALDPRTGAILALASTPSYDPSTLSSHDSARITAAYKQLSDDPSQPLLDRALSQTYPPGSLFKIVTASAALSTGRYTPSSRIPTPQPFTLTGTTTALSNFNGETCGSGGTDTMLDAFTISCNSAFAGLAHAVGTSAFADQAHAFGIGQSISVPLPVATSHFPDDANAPQTELAGIGQGDVALTPLQAAMIGGAIANGGEVMQPYLVSEIRAPDTSVIDTASPKALGRAVSPQVAGEVRTMMESVVAAPNGTGSAARISGITVAGKTGTAEHGTAQQHLAPDVWFVAFAPAENPTIAVAVVVEDGGGLGGSATGGTVAAPIARSVICAVLHCP